MRYCYSLTGSLFEQIPSLQQNEAVGFELRLDSLGQAPDAVALRALTTRPLLATYRSKPHLGLAVPAQRAGEGWVWRKACLAAGFDFIDLELDEPGLEEKIAEIQAAGAKVVLSHHDLGDGQSLDAALEQALASRADILKIVASGRSSGCIARQRQYYGRAGQRCLIHFAMGAEFAATRVLSLVLGAPFTFISPEAGAAVAPGQLTLAQMEEGFRARSLRLAGLKLFAVIGSPIGHSRSPHYHNPKLAAEYANALFVALPASSASDLELLLETWPELCGLAVTKPMKEVAFARADAYVDAVTAQLGAVNTLLKTSEGWRAANTDMLAMIELLCDLPKEKLVRVLGHGGLGKAVVAACLQLGLAVEVSNRTLCALDPGASWVPWAERHRPGAQVIVQATSVGMAPAADATPLERLPPTIELLIETIYNPEQTRMMSMGHAAGVKVISGSVLFETQARVQSELFVMTLM